jgi:predicted nucleic acid-binding protein
MPFLLDTNILSELRRLRLESKVVDLLQPSH